MPYVNIPKSNLAPILALQVGRLEGTFTTKINDFLKDVQEKFEQGCPSEQQIQTITTQLNTVKDLSVSVTDKLNRIKGLTPALRKNAKVIQVGTSVLKALPIPGLALTAGATTTFSDTLHTIKEFSTQLGDTADSIDSIISQADRLKQLLQKAVDLIDKVEKALEICEECKKQGADCSKELINDIVSGDENKSNQALSKLSSNLGLGLQRPEDFINQPPGDLQEDLQDNEEKYKDYTIRVVEVPSDFSRAKLRQAVAVNKNGIVEFRGNKSFSSSTEILKKEVRFYIDNKVTVENAQTEGAVDEEFFKENQTGAGNLFDPVTIYNTFQPTFENGVAVSEEVSGLPGSGGLLQLGTGGLITETTSGGYEISVELFQDIQDRLSELENNFFEAGALNGSGVDDRLVIWEDKYKLGSSPTLTFVNGNLGVGTNEPNDRLTIIGDVYTSGKIRIESGNSNFLTSTNFAPDFTGQGVRIELEDSTGASRLTVDNLVVRQRLSVYELLINQIRATNGSLFVSSTGRILSSSLSGSYTINDESKDVYTLFFDTGSAGSRFAHGFMEGDLILAQRVNPDIIPGSVVYNDEEGRPLQVVYRSEMQVIKYVSPQSVDAVLLYDGDENFDSKPQEGFDYVRIGNTSSLSNRQGTVYLTADDENAPYIDVVDGVSSHDDWFNKSKLKVRMGKLDGITEGLSSFGELSGYGFWASGSAYLEGGINATEGKIADITIEPGKLYINGLEQELTFSGSWISGNIYNQYDWVTYVTGGVTSSWYASSSHTSSDDEDTETGKPGYGPWNVLPGKFENADTPFFVSSSGQLSLKDKFVWDGEQLTIRGAINQTSDGTDIVQFNFRGPWQPDFDYDKNDLVTYVSSSKTGSWYSTATHTSTNDEETGTGKPGYGPWSVFASAGEPGLPGSSGLSMNIEGNTFIFSYDKNTRKLDPTNQTGSYTASVFNSSVGERSAKYQWFFNGKSLGDPSTFENSGSYEFHPPEDYPETPQVLRVEVTELENNITLTDQQSIFSSIPRADNDPIYQIVAENGTIIRNNDSSTFLTMSLVSSSQSGPVTITNGDIKLYSKRDGSYTLARELPGASGTEYRPFIGIQAITGSLIIEAVETGSNGNEDIIYDTITLVDVTDGLQAGTFTGDSDMTREYNETNNTYHYVPSQINITGSFFTPQGIEYTASLVISASYSQSQKTDYMYYLTGNIDNSIQIVSVTDADKNHFEGTGFENRLPTKDVDIKLKFTNPNNPTQQTTISERWHINSDGIDGLDSIDVVLSNERVELISDYLGTITDVGEDGYEGSDTQIDVLEGNDLLQFVNDTTTFNGPLSWSIYNVTLNPDDGIETGSITEVNEEKYAQVGIFDNWETDENKITVTYYVTGSRRNNTPFNATGKQTLIRNRQGIPGVNPVAVEIRGDVFAFKYDKNDGTLNPDTQTGSYTASVFNTANSDQIWYEWFVDGESLGQAGLFEDSGSIVYTPPETFLDLPQTVKVEIRSGSDNDFPVLSEDRQSIIGLRDAADNDPIYQLQALEGTIIKNNEPDKKLQVRLISSSQDGPVIISNGDIKLYSKRDGSYTLARELPGADGTEYSASFTRNSITGSLVIEAVETGSGTDQDIVYDTITLVDVQDGLGGGAFTVNSYDINRTFETDGGHSYNPPSIFATASFFGLRKGDGTISVYTSSFEIIPSYSASQKTDYLHYIKGFQDPNITIESITDADGNEYQGSGKEYELATKNITFNLSFKEPGDSTGNTTRLSETFHINSDGIDGLDSIFVEFEGNIVNIPANSNGVVVDGGYEGTDGEIRVYEGDDILQFAGKNNPLTGPLSWSIYEVEVSSSNSIKTGSIDISEDGVTADLGNLSEFSESVDKAKITYRITGSRENNTGFTAVTEQIITKVKQGEPGQQGSPGAGVVYRGKYDSNKTYYFNTTRRDVVKYQGDYYLTNNPSKNGESNWDTPDTETDWIEFGAQFESVATDILLAQDTTITRGLVMGADTEEGSSSFIRSIGATSLDDGQGFYLSSSGDFRFGDGSENSVKWDGSSLTVKGEINATSGFISGALSMSQDGAIRIGDGMLIDPDGLLTPTQLQANFTGSGSFPDVGNSNTASFLIEDNPEFDELIAITGGSTATSSLVDSTLPIELSFSVQTGSKENVDSISYIDLNFIVQSTNVESPNNSDWQIRKVLTYSYPDDEVRKEFPLQLISTAGDKYVRISYSGQASFTLTDYNESLFFNMELKNKDGDDVPFFNQYNPSTLIREDGIYVRASQNTGVIQLTGIGEGGGGGGVSGVTFLEFLELENKVTDNEDRIIELENFSSSLDTTYVTVAELDEVSSSIDGRITTVSQSIGNGTITILAGTALSTGGSFTTNQSSNGTITIDHSNVNRTDPGTTTSNLSFGGTFTTTTDVTSDSQGHITGESKNTFTLPSLPSDSITGTGASGQVAYFSNSHEISGESNLFWDDTNDRLGVKTTTPSTELEVSGSITTDKIISSTYKYEDLKTTFTTEQITFTSGSGFDRYDIKFPQKIGGEQFRGVIEVEWLANGGSVSHQGKLVKRFYINIDDNDDTVLEIDENISEYPEVLSIDARASRTIQIGTPYLETPGSLGYDGYLNIPINWNSPGSRNGRFLITIQEDNPDFYANNYELSGSFVGNNPDSSLTQYRSFYDRVGINTNTPSKELTVEGDVSASGNLDIDGNTTLDGTLYVEGAGSFNSDIKSPTYDSGFGGSGWRVDSNSNAEFQNLTVRGTFSVYELLAQQIRATNGSLLVATSAKVDSVNGTTTGTLTFDTGSAYGHGFLANDIILAQRLNADGTAILQTFLRVDSRVDSGSLTYTKLSGNNPQAGQEFVRIGNTTNTDRQGHIYLTADDTNAPYIGIRDGVDEYTDFTTGTGSIEKVRVGRLDGVTSDTFGSLSGYGFWAKDNAYLEGGISATFGTIGGFSITENAISSSDDSLILRSNGQITGSQVQFTGGKIGGFKITSGSGGEFLKNTNETFYLRGDATGSKYLISSSKFILTADGDITARNADISGSIRATSGEIAGTLTMGTQGVITIAESMSIDPDKDINTVSVFQTGSDISLTMSNRTNIPVTTLIASSSVVEIIDTSLPIELSLTISGSTDDSNYEPLVTVKIQSWNGEPDYTTGNNPRPLDPTNRAEIVYSGTGTQTFTEMIDLQGHSHVRLVASLGEVGGDTSQGNMKVSFGGEDLNENPLFRQYRPFTLVNSDGVYVRVSPNFINRIVGNTYSSVTTTAQQTPITPPTDTTPPTEITEYLKEWNFISNPSTQNISVESLKDIFTRPNSNISEVNNGTLYEFDGSYTVASELEPGKGYWVNLKEKIEIDWNESITERGLITQTQAIEIEVDLPANASNGYWVLHGSLGVPSEIVSVNGSGSVLSGTTYDFTGTYILTNELEPGKGYFTSFNLPTNHNTLKYRLQPLQN